MCLNLIVKFQIRMHIRTVKVLLFQACRVFAMERKG